MSESPTQSVLFADITDSMRLLAEVGDTVGREMVSDCLEAWSRIVAEHHGEVIQIRGDGMLCIFPDAPSAIGAAVIIRAQQAINSVSMHAGIDTGTIKRDGEQLYGDVVNTASRVCDLAKAGEILITAQSLNRVTQPARWDLRLIENVWLKGKPAPIDLYVIAESTVAITTYDPSSQKQAPSDKLRLMCFDQVMTLDDARPNCVLGRQDDCDMVVDTDKASRRHASVECKRGKFFLHDHSMNGTFVYDGNHSEPILLRRDTVQLQGRGTISLGCERTDNAVGVIRYLVA